MISHNVGDTVYVPFWVIQEYYDSAPPDPFIKCIISGISSKLAVGPNGNENIVCVDLNLGKPGLNALSIPLSYCISHHELPQWCQRIADWFLNFKTEP